jgi:hypothetical protein
LRGPRLRAGLEAAKLGRGVPHAHAQQDVLHLRALRGEEESRMMRGSEVWKPLRSITDDLQMDGWVTPDTYCEHFAPITDQAAVYLFLVVDRETYDRGFVGYVGMSRKLLQRMNAHNILPLLDGTIYWTMRWFKPAKPAVLRSIESEYITRFDPPWNIIGRPSGVFQ